MCNSVIRLKKKFVACLSLELQQIECALRHDANHLYVMADLGHIVIVHCLLSSYCTPRRWVTKLPLHASAVHLLCDYAESLKLMSFVVFPCQLIE